MRKSLWNWVLVGFSFVALSVYLVKTEGKENIINIFSTIDYLWIAIALVSTIFFWIIDASILFFVMLKFSGGLSFSYCFRSSMIGFLFGFLTPLQSGNITSQVIVLGKKGIKPGDAVAMLLTKNIIMVGALVILMTIAVISRGSSLYIQAPGLFFVVIIGLFLNIFTIVLMIVAGLAEKPVRNILLGIIRFLAKIKIIKDLKLASEWACEEISRLHHNFYNLKKQSRMIVRGIGIGFLGILSSSQISYFIYRSFGLTTATYYDVVSGQIFSSIIQSIIPLPGGIGFTDGGFYFILINLFSYEYINFALILWRFFTFYLPIIIGLTLLLLFKRNNNNLLKES